MGILYELTDFEERLLELLNGIDGSLARIDQHLDNIGDALEALLDPDKKHERQLKEIMAAAVQGQTAAKVKECLANENPETSGYDGIFNG